MAILSAFRYSGNKGRMLKHYKKYPGRVDRVVEPYAGSMAFSVNFDLDVPCIGYEMNERICALWGWLINADEDYLRRWGAWVSEHVEGQKIDVRKLELPLGQQTYLQLSICSVMVGQLSSWTVYPQHSVPLEKTIKCLDRVHSRITVHRGDANDYQPQSHDLLFIDPPYVGTYANYVSSKGKVDAEYDPEDTMVLIDSTNNPIILTYGDSAPQVFPSYDWEVATVRKVPNIRRGGTVERTEYVAYINW